MKPVRRSAVLLTDPTQRLSRGPTRMSTNRTVNGSALTEEQLYTTVGDVATRFSLKKGLDRHAADDMAAEVRQGLFERRSKEPTWFPKSLESWTCGVVSRKLAQQARDRIREEPLESLSDADLYQSARPWDLFERKLEQLELHGI